VAAAQPELAARRCWPPRACAALPLLRPTLLPAARWQCSPLQPTAANHRLRLVSAAAAGGDADPLEYFDDGDDDDSSAATSGPPPPPPPQWLPYPVAPPDPRVARLAAALGLPMSDAEVLALLAPEALHLDASDLAGRLAALQRLLPSGRGGAAALARAAAADPALLLAPRATVPARLRAAAAALRLTRRQLLGPGRSELRLQLATRPAEAVVRRVRLFADMLGIEAGEARRLVLDSPRLLSRRTAAVRVTAEALEQVRRRSLLFLPMDVGVARRGSSTALISLIPPTPSPHHRRPTPDLPGAAPQARPPHPPGPRAPRAPGRPPLHRGGRAAARAAPVGAGPRGRAAAVAGRAGGAAGARGGAGQGHCFADGS
jgi:hypothetical protein